MSRDFSVTSSHLQGWVKYVQSATTHAERAKQAIFDRYSVYAMGLSLVGLSGELGWRMDVLEALRQAHYDAEIAYAAEQSDDPAVRAALDDAEGVVRAELIAQSQLFAAMFGPDAAVSVGLAGPTPEGGELLVKFADRVLGKLKAEPVRTTRYGSPFDLTMNIQTLEAGLSSLRAAQVAHAREARELQEAKLDRDRAQEALRAAYVQIATYYESLFRMAGLHELADRLRPTARRAASVEPPPAEPLVIEPLAGA